jgi:hypothetical protein
MCPETSVCWDMGGVRVIPTADALRGFHAFQHNFQLFGAQRCALGRTVLVIKYSCLRRPMGLWDVEAATLSRQSAHRWRWSCQPYAPVGRPLPPGRYLVLTSDRHSLLVTITPRNHRSALNKRKISGVPTANIQGNKVRDWCKPVDWASDSYLCSCAVWQCGGNEVVPHHAWITCVIVIEEAHVARVLVNHAQNNDSTLHPSFC